MAPSAPRPLVPLPLPDRPHRVVFEGPFVNARARPSLKAAVTRTLPRGADLSVTAQRGVWLRTKAGDFVLKSHPALGRLVGQVVDEDG